MKQKTNKNKNTKPKFFSTIWLAIYNFIKHVFFGIAFPFVAILRVIITPKKVDVEKLKKEAEKKKIE